MGLPMMKQRRKKQLATLVFLVCAFAGEAFAQGGQLPKLLQELSAKDSKRRVKATAELGKLGRGASGTVLAQVQKGLLTATDDRDWEVRKEAYQAIQNLGSKKAQALLPVLFAGLKDKDSDVVTKAEACIASIKPKPSQVSDFVRLLKSKHWAIRRGAAQKLGQLGPKARSAIFELIKRVQDSDSDVTTAIQRAIQKIGVGPADQGQLEKLLSHSKWKTRYYGATFLGQLGAKARSSIPKLVAVTSDKDSDVATAAKRAIERIGVDKTLVPALQTLMTARTWKSRWYGARLAGQIGAEARSTLPALVVLSSDSDSDVASMAAKSIAKVGVDVSSIPGLLPLLKHRSWKTRWYVAHLLGKLGPKARPAYNELLRHKGDPDSDARSEISKALKAIGASRLSLPALLKNFPKESAPSQIRILQDIASLYANAPIPKSMLEPVQRACLLGLKSSSWECRRQAAKSLGVMGKKARWGLRALVTAASDRDSDVSNEAGAAIPKLGVHVAQISEYTALLKDSHWKSRFYGATFLGQLGQDATSALPQLIPAASDRDSDVAAAAKKAITKIGSHESLVPQFTSLLQSPQWLTRWYALSLLGRLGAKSQPAFLAILKCVADQDSDVAKLAPKTLKAVGPAKSHLNGLIKHASSQNWNIRFYSLRMLAVIGEGQKSVLNQGLISTTDSDTDVRREALRLIVKVDPKGQGVAAKSFLAFIQAPEKEQMKQLNELGKLGDKAKPFVGLLLIEVNNNRALKSPMAIALRGIGLGDDDYLWILKNGREALQLWAVQELGASTIIRGKTNELLKAFARNGCTKKVKAAAKKYAS